MHQGLPDIRLFDPGPSLYILIDDSHEIAASCEFHDNAEIARGVIVEGLFELDDIVVGQRGEDPDLVEGVLLLFLLHAGHAHLLQRVGLVVDATTHLVDLTEGALPHLPYDLELL